MLQEHSQFEEIDFDTPQVHTPHSIHGPRNNSHHQRSRSLTDKEIYKARRTHSNELEQRIEMLRYIESKERMVADLREQLQAHEMELWLLKENWTRMVTQSSHPELEANQKNEERPITNNSNIPRTALSQGLLSMYQNLRDTLENVAQTERHTLTTTLRSAMERTYQVMSAPILEDDGNQVLDYFSTMPVSSAATVFGRSPLFVTSPWSQGTTISVVPPRLKKPEPVRPMTS